MVSINNLKKAIDSIKYRDRILQADIAEKMGYKNPYLSDVINGRKPISDQFTDKFCTLFHINKSWLLTGKGEIFTNKEYEDDNVSNKTNEDYVCDCPMQSIGESFAEIAKSVTIVAKGNLELIQQQSKLIEMLYNNYINNGTK